MNLATIDFETRSALSLLKHGSWIYSKHKTTEAMCLAYELPGYKEPRLWHMAHPQHLIAESPPPQDLFDHIADGGLVEAHNSFFERVIWMHQMVKNHGWPEMPHLQWRCSASRASAASLPRDLSGAVKAKGLPEEFHKDMGGRALMLKMCKPRKPRKAEIQEWMEAVGKTGDYRRFAAAFTAANGPLWHEPEDDIYNNWAYCKQDIRAEKALSGVLPQLTDDELAVWQMDQQMNERGAKFDLELARKALEMAGKWKEKLNKELEDMTGVDAGTKRQKVKDWLVEHEGLELPDTTAVTLEHYVANEPISGRARRVCEIVMDVNRTSTRKYQAMLDKCDPDDWRARDLLRYHGANTGRWSGNGIQVHNFPARDLIISDFDEAVVDIKSGDIEWCHAMYTDVMKLLSHSLRGAIVPEEGTDFIVADYASIEARCLLWEAGAQKALEIFYQGGDIYCDMATGIYGYEVIKGVHKLERQFGKQSILGLGFSMGFLTFLLTCRKYNIHFSRKDVLRIMGVEQMAKYEAWIRNYLCMDGLPVDMDRKALKKYRNKKRQAAKAIRRLVDAREDPKAIVHELALMKYTVDVYRNRYLEVKVMWNAQEAAAIKVVQQWQRAVEDARRAARQAFEESGEEISFGLMEWETTAWRDQFTSDRVECGKVTWFVEGGFLNCELPSGRCLKYRDPEVKMVRTSWGEEKPGLRYYRVNGVTRKWERTHTYGGKLVENITQAIARDIMANAMMLSRDGGTYFVVISVHDELVAEVSRGQGSEEDFEDLMGTVPHWAAGCPIAAEADRMARYRK